MINEISALISLLSAIFITVTIPTFTFASTLLNKVLAKLETQKKHAVENSKADIDTRIISLQKQVTRLSGRDSEVKRFEKLKSELESLELEEEKLQKKLQKIESRYASLDLFNGVIFPTCALALAIILSCVIKNIESNFTLISHYISIKLLLLFLDLTFFFYAIYKIYRTLSLIQEVSSPSDDFQTKQIAEALKIALDQHSLNNNEEASVVLEDNNFFNIGEKAKINFSVSLSKGRVLKDVKVFFYLTEVFTIPDGLATILQRPDFRVPNAKTIVKSVGDVSIGVRSAGFVEFITPAVSGKYTIYYQLFGQGYRKDIESFVIDVINLDDIPF